ncbi:alpha/beta hydrolase [Embleya sp. NBC_00896]|uniref:alpha/beta hydrolase n=1 Tax=Embleya sp. NBC_00896 TaxID=2975961 RepID=UPI003866FE8C|nr:alpha/beta hydrolase [Embleya sp. NBC_00896]
MSDSRDVLTRPAAGPDRTLRYGPAADHVVDVWTPAAEPRGLVVVVHGGYWRAEYDRVHTYPMCVALAAEGYTVASIEYRRAGQPGGGRPGTFADVAAALDLLCGEATGPVVVVGHSAGGHLAAWAGLRHRLPAGGVGRLPEPPPLTGVVSLAGVLDLGAALALDLDDGAAAEFLGEPSEEVLAHADPLRLTGTDVGGPRFVLLHGDADDLVPIELSRAFAKASGTELRVLPGIGHFEPIDPHSTAWPEVLRAVSEAFAAGR